MILFLLIFETYITPKPWELGTWNFDTIFTTPYVSSVTCQMTGVRCRVSHIRCHMSHVTHEPQRTNELPFWEKVHLLPLVICHFLFVIHVMYHMSLIFIFFFFHKVWRLVGGGSLINRAYLYSSFLHIITKSFFFFLMSSMHTIFL